MRRGRESRGADEAPHPSGRASRGGRRRRALWGKTKPSGGTFGGLARFRLRARVTRKRKRGFPPAPRGAGGAGRASRARAPPPSPRSRPSGRPRRGSRPPRPPGPPSTRGGRRREVGARRFVQSDTSRLPRWHPFLFFFPPERATNGRPDERERETGAGFPARAARLDGGFPRSRLPRGTRGERLGGRRSRRVSRAPRSGRRAEGRRIRLPSDPPREGKRGTLPPRGAATRAAPPSAPSASPRARLLRVRPRARSRSAGGSSRAPPRVRARRRAMRARAGALFASCVKRPPPFPTAGRFRSVRSQRPVLAFGRRRARRGVENPTVLSLELLRTVRVSADRRIRKYLVVVLGYARAHGEAAPTMIRGGRASTDRFRHASHFYFRARARRRDALLFRSKGARPASGDVSALVVPRAVARRRSRRPARRARVRVRARRGRVPRRRRRSSRA